MKLSRSVIAFASVHANNFEKCDQLEAANIANISPTGMKCADATCTLKCEDGYSAMSPNKMKCIKEDGEWFWNKKGFGGCSTCKEISGIEDENMTVECKVNSDKKRICKFTCPEGTLFNGKEGKTFQKLTCKCGKTKCKWRNDKNKKISGATYRGYKCVGEPTGSTDKPDTETPVDTTIVPPVTDAPPVPTTETTTASPVAPGQCYDTSSGYGINENSDGTGGCAPNHTSYLLINADESNSVTAWDPHMVMGEHVSDRQFVSAGFALENEDANIAKYEAIVNSIELCPKMSDYSIATGSSLKPQNPTGTYKCHKHIKWSYRSNVPGKSEKFGYVATSPDGTFVIAAGVVEGEKVNNRTELHRFLVKLDAQTGAVIWEIKMPKDDPMMKTRSGYESVRFTEDGGFIAGGFARWQSEEFPFFKSSGQVDEGFPIMEKFSANVANSNTQFDQAPTPEWQYMCGSKGTHAACTLTGSAKTMRVYKDDGVEKVVALSHGCSFMVLDAGNGSALGLMNNREPENKDSPQDVEVEIVDGKVKGFVVAGIHGGTDTETAGCTEKGDCTDPVTGQKACCTIEGFIAKWDKTLTTRKWHTVFNDFSGGVGMFSGLTSYSKTMVLTECWGISKIPGGYVAGCGQGQEGCKNSQVDSSVKDQCKKDPRGAWRGTAVAVGMDGAIDWYRMDNWDDKSGDQVSTSAYEWVSYNGAADTLMFLGDEAMGFGYSTLDLNSATTD